MSDYVFPRTSLTLVCIVDAIIENLRRLVHILIP